MHNLSPLTLQSIKNGQLSGNILMDKVYEEFTLVTCVAKNPRNKEIQYHQILDNTTGKNLMGPGNCYGKSYRMHGQNYIKDSGRLAYGYDPRIFNRLRAQFGNQFDYIAINVLVTPQAGIKSNKKDWIAEGTSFDYTLSKGTAISTKKFTVVDVEELSSNIQKVIIKNKKTEKLYYNLIDTNLNKTVTVKPVPMAKNELPKVELAQGVATPIAYKLAKMLNASVYMYGAATALNVL